MIESALYEPVRNYLSLNLSKILSRKAGAGSPVVYVDNVSTAAGTGDGTWTRPDLAAIAFTKGMYLPFLRADLHTFEVKTAQGLDVKGVHEANAHGKLGHFAWIIFQAVGNAARSGETYDRVLSSANNLGVGVITFRCPNSADGWYVDAWPHRTSTDDSVADTFVGQRFKNEVKKNIKDYLSHIIISGDGR